MFDKIHTSICTVVTAAALGVFALFSASSPASASVITYTFDGVLAANADTEFPTGDPFSGFLTIDTSVGGILHPDLTLDLQYAAITDWAATFSSLPATFSGSSGSVAVGDNTTFGDRLIFTMNGTPDSPLPSGRGLNFLQLDFQDPLGSGVGFLSSDAIPTSIDLSHIAGSFGRLFLDGSQLQITTTDISPAVVPLPAAFPLFGIGLGILGFIGWRRRRKAQAV